ncbi:uncharacterized protein VTP21DRAFT_6405 [Calcarisporiella thermophila]|uniref:uncharacterized protein n=1 Tax=Calcarisporiella thermophila TaxID=911321 RepID=UPI003743D556
MLIARGLESRSYTAGIPPPPVCNTYKLRAAPQNQDRNLPVRLVRIRPLKQDHKPAAGEPDSFLTHFNLRQNPHSDNLPQDPPIPGLGCRSTHLLAFVTWATLEPP